MIGYQIEIKFKRDSNEQFLRASISTDDYSAGCSAFTKLFGVMYPAF